jgi:Protein of unknown function (DUF742)
MPAGDKWVDRNAGPVVRPYALTGGRTQPVSGTILDLIAVVVAAGRADRNDLALSPEHRRILGLCRSPTTVADVASAISLPVGVVRVLLADLIPQGRIKVMTQRQTDRQASADLLKEVLHGLRSL